MLSRCTTRNALITLNFFTNYLAKWFVPDIEVLNEDDRLKKLSNELIFEMDEEENSYKKNEEVNTTKIIRIVNQLNSIVSNTNSNKNLITNKNIITGVKEPKIAPVNNAINYSEQELSDETAQLLSERKRPLTVDEKNIVKQSLCCNRENINDIIIQRYGIYFLT
jgi:hypothetical protein